MAKDKGSADVAVQPALPTLELPDFEGLKPVGVVTRLNGAGNRIARAMHIGEKVVLVVEAEVTAIGHKKTKDGLKRVPGLEVADLYELEGPPGRRLLRGLREAYRLADDARHGRRGFEQNMDPSAPGVEVTTDGSGVLVTPGERSALAELGLPDVEAVAVVFEGGRRALWPDDWDTPVERPAAGNFIAPPDGKDDELVRQLLDVDTGETVDEWTDAQENERLKAEEDRLAAEEAKADREATEELQAARGRDVDGKIVKPWRDYDDMAAADVVKKVAGLGQRNKVEQVRAYEEAHGGRSTILKATAKKLLEIGE